MKYLALLIQKIKEKMSTINMTLGARQQVATVTVLDSNGHVVPSNELIITYTNDNEVALKSQGANTFAPTAVGTADVQFSAQFTAAAGGGPVVAAPSDTVVVSVAPIASVSVSWAPAP